MEKCECSDPGCAAHRGKSDCRGDAVVTLFRIDMEDVTGTPFCEPCAEDAVRAGVYTS